MKLLPLAQAIFAKYKLKPIEFPDNYRNVYEYLQENPEKKSEFSSEKTDAYFLKKYRANIPDGWYGFSLGDPIVPTWTDILDEILEICIKNDHYFEIHQIKIKFGGIRFYVESEIIEDIHEIESLIDSTLYDRALIY